MSNFTDFINASPIKSIQRGSTSTYNSTVAVTITAVDRDKTFVNGASWHNGAGNPHGRLYLASSTTLNVVGGYSSGTVYWEVIEYV